MGISVDYDCFDGSYTRYNRLLKAWALAAGWTNGEPSSQTRSDPLNIIFDASVSKNEEGGSYGEEAGSISYSYCIVPEDAERLALRLEELLPALAKEDKFSTKRFIRGLYRAVKENMDVVIHL